MPFKNLHLLTSHFYDKNNNQHSFENIPEGFNFPSGTYVEYINKLGETDIIGLEKIKFQSFNKVTRILRVDVKYKKDTAGFKNFPLLKGAKYINN